MRHLIIVSSASITEVLTELCGLRYLPGATVCFGDVTTLEIRIRSSRPRPTRVRFGVPNFRSIHGGVPVTMLTIPNDAIASVPLIITDAVGAPHAPDTEHVTVTVADPTVASAAITSDGAWVEITPLVLNGNSSVTYTDTDDNITASMDFTISTPAPVTVSLNESGAVLRRNDNPPTA